MIRHMSTHVCTELVGDKVCTEFVGDKVCTELVGDKVWRFEVYLASRFAEVVHWHARACLHSIYSVSVR